MNQPIKRHTALQPLSREHHLALLLCYKIEQGFRLGVEVQRIKKYNDWFFENYLLPHFEVEEKHLFPILGNDHPMIHQALEDHNRLKNLFEAESTDEDSLKATMEKLEQHVRFEERVLFNEIQLSATAEQLSSLESHLVEENFCENEEDIFWIPVSK